MQSKFANYSNKKEDMTHKQEKKIFINSPEMAEMMKLLGP